MSQRMRTFVFALTLASIAAIALAAEGEIPLSPVDRQRLETVITNSMFATSGTALSWFGSGDTSGSVTPEPAYRRATHEACGAQCSDPCRDVQYTVVTRQAFAKYTGTRCLASGTSWVRVGDDRLGEQGSFVPPPPVLPPPAPPLPPQVAVAPQRPAQCVNSPTPPSFDCCKASSWSEKQICSTPSLANADRQMAQLYSKRVGELSGQTAVTGELRRAQREWILNRETCQKFPDAITCLSDQYQGRIAELSAAALVVQLQGGLKRLLYYRDKIDGKFGLETLRATKKFLEDERVILQPAPTEEVVHRVTQALNRIKRTDCASFSIVQPQASTTFVACGQMTSN